jgi:thiamine pyrophosphokinase
MIKGIRQINNSCLIVLDGEINKSLLNKYINKSETKPVLISADGASNKLYEWKIIPGFIIGDLDSITPKALTYFKKKNATVKRIAEQEHNDFEKCIMFALSKKLNDITVIGYGGKRSDHMLNNFSVMKRYYKKCRIRFIDKDFEVFFAGKITGFNCKIGETISLMAMPKAEGITTYGLQYPLKNEKLEFGIREGALNKAVSDKVRIEVKKGDLVIFKKNVIPAKAGIQ